MKTEANQYEVSLNLRGRVRRAGVKTWKNLQTNGKQNMIIIGATLVLYLLFTLINSNFSSKSNLLTLAKSLVPYAILGLGVTFVISTGGIDLSIGTVCIAAPFIAGAICGTTTSAQDGILWLTIPIMLIVGVLFGLLNGLLIAKCKLPPFIATLGTMLLSRGLSAVIAQAITKSTSAIKYPSVSWLQKVFSNVNGFPIGLVWVLGLTIICMIVMFKTKIGRYILAIGSNEEATRLSGINVDFYKIIAYVIGGLFAGIAAIFYTTTNPSLTLAGGNGIELDAIAGVYIGGTSTTGGTASIVGTIFGAIILVVIRQGLNLSLSALDNSLNASFITYTVTGVIVVAAVLLDIFKKKAAARVTRETRVQKAIRVAKEKISLLKDEKDVELTKMNAARVGEIDSEIASIRKELSDSLPGLREEDRKEAEENRRKKQAQAEEKKKEKQKKKQEKAEKKKQQHDKK